METPDHIHRLKMQSIRQQAMDAVSHYETTAQIRAFNGNGIETAPGFTPVEFSTEPPGPLTDDIRQQAMDAVSHRETTAAIRHMDFDDAIRPDHTPSVKNSIIAERIAEMHKMNQDVGAIQQTITKDNFGRENEIG